MELGRVFAAGIFIRRIEPKQRRSGIRVFSRFLSIFISTFVISALAAPATVHAQDSKTRSGLFSGSAREKAEQRRGKPSRNARTYTGETQGGEFSELDTVDEILEDRRGENFFNQYRGPFYMSYVYDVVPVRELEDWETKAMAEKVFVYQAASELSRVIVKSALEPAYRRAVEAVRWFRDYTSLKVGRQEDGALGVAESDEDKSPLLEFKLHVSANYGVEPRIKIGENCTLRYDVIHSDTLLEFRREF